MDRDLNAALNLLALTLEENTASSAGMNACGENVRPKQLVRAVSLKQEPNTG